MPYRYRYSPQEKWTTVDGDDYLLEPEQGSCYVGYNVTFDVTIREHYYWFDDRETGITHDTRFSQDWEDYTVSHTFGIPPGYKIESPPFFLTVNPINTRPKDGGASGEPFWYAANEIRIWGVNINGSRTGRNRTFRSYRVRDTTVHNAQRFLADSIRNVSYAPLSPEPDDCARNCVFKVFKEEELILELTRNTCPEVEEAVGCPSGTCKVDCGSVCCCYGSDGIAVSSIPKGGA